jgi:hypothetical protein
VRETILFACCATARRVETNVRRVSAASNNNTVARFDNSAYRTAHFLVNAGRRAGGMGLTTRPCFSRDSEDAIDLCDALIVWATGSLCGQVHNGRAAPMSAPGAKPKNTYSV